LEPVHQIELRDLSGHLNGLIDIDID